MNTVQKYKLHLQTIRNHRRVVRKWCRKMQIPLLGLKHDLSKYSITELAIAKWYTGTSGPHDTARKVLGYSPSWYHHMHKNKHHWERWVAYNSAYCDSNDTWWLKAEAIKMPYKYVIEMFCDFIGAGQAYEKNTWTINSPYNYYMKKCFMQRYMHTDSEALLVLLLTKLKDLGEKGFVKWYKANRKILKLSYKNSSIADYVE